MNKLEKLFTILKMAVDLGGKPPSISNLAGMVQTSIPHAKAMMTRLEESRRLTIIRMSQDYSVVIDGKKSKNSRTYATSSDSPLTIDATEMDGRKAECQAFGALLKKHGCRFEDVKLKINRNPRRYVADRHSYGVAEYGT